ncbi:MAG: hypothetical protein ACO3A2_05355 [Bdellovibrionia bacterium]
MLGRDLPGGVTFFLSASIAVFLSWATSGCRMGNFQQTRSRSSGSDSISGYYATSPDTLKFYVATTTGLIEKSAPLTLLPSEMTQVVTNPVALILTQASTGAARLINPTGQSYLPIFVNSDQTLSYAGNSEPAPFFLDPACKSSLEIVEWGKVNPNRDASLAPSSPTLALLGTLELTVQVMKTLSGECEATLLQLSACAQSAQNCGGTTEAQNQELHTWAEELFEPWILSGALSLADLPQMHAFAYEVTFKPE